MPTFIDESGDTGRSRDSSACFRLAAVWMPSETAANEFREAVRQYRSSKGMSAKHEFKFTLTHSQPQRRREFLTISRDFGYRFVFCSIDKRQKPWNNAPSSALHWAAATTLAVLLRPTYHAAEREQPGGQIQDTIIVDDNRDKRFLSAVWTAFQGLRSATCPGTEMVRRPRFRSSGQDEVLQLADMVCGATGAAIDGDSAWYDRICEHCQDKMFLP